ncbi:MAG: hypothetical protein JWN10_2315 [Solirubrobacterales bacterium]|nr:hypothetical protein [Solirubrobacterales bacterium]
MTAARVTHGEARGFGFGPRRAVAGVLLLAVVLGVVALLAAGHGKPDASSNARYGGLPGWLPKATVPVGRIVHASAAHSVLAIEGDTVAVGLASGDVSATVVGPSVPESGRFPVPRTSPCTFVVTFAATSGVIPLRSADLTITDEQGRLHHPKVTALHGGVPPRRITPGKPISLEVYAVLPTGSGSVSWAPESRRPIVSWDFDVEID